MNHERPPLPPAIAKLLGPGPSAALVDSIEDTIRNAINDHDGEIAVAALKTGIALLSSPAKAQAAVDMLMGLETRSDAEVAASLGETRASLSKRHIKIRANLKISQAHRYPENKRAGAKRRSVDES